MNETPELREILLKAASSWPDLTSSYVDPDKGAVESNLFDVLFYASEVMKLANVVLPRDFPDRPVGVYVFGAKKEREQSRCPAPARSLVLFESQIKRRLSGNQVIRGI